MNISEERHFRAMGSDAHLIVVSADRAEELLEAAQHRIEALEQRWSRFIDTSEVCAMNRHAGDVVDVSADTVLLVERAVDAWRLTGGGFDATVLGAMVRAGYDASFENLTADRVAPSSPLSIGCTDIVVSGATVRLPRGTGFDPGGIGKGLAADIVTAELLAAGALGACVNLGGDLRVTGAGPSGDGWTVAIEHPVLPEPLALIGLRAGAVATSTTLRRRWTIAGEDRHHLVDPATGLPSDSDLAFVTVIAGEGWLAEVLAKAVLLRGSARAFDIVDDTCHALTVDLEGTVRTTTGFAAFTSASVPA